MNFTYFHGTSSIFLDSIIEFGLGGINPNIEFKNLALLQYLNKDAEKFLLQDEDYLKIRKSATAMANQSEIIWEFSPGKSITLNYNHKNIYVSLSRERALFYACLNNYGSEILEYSIAMYLRLKSKFENYELPNELNLFGIDKLVDKTHRKILIELGGVRDTNLATEFGEDARTILNMLRLRMPTMKEKEKFEQFQFINFRLLKSVPMSNMKFYEIDHEGHPRTHDFSWTLTNI